MPYAYQAGDNCYGRGDYYRGDYYQGDFLGIGKFVGKVAKTVTGLAAAVGIPGAGIANKVATRLTGGGGGNALIPQLQMPPLDQYGLININQGGGGTNGYTPGMSLTPSGAMVPCQLKGYRVNKSGYYRHPRGNPQAAVYVPPKSVCVKSRRLNVANPRALRRAIRRAQGFAKLAKRVMTFVSAKAPKGRAKFKRKR